MQDAVKVLVLQKKVIGGGRFMFATNVVKVMIGSRIIVEPPSIA